MLGEKASAHLTLGVTPRGMLGFLSHEDVGFLVRRRRVAGTFSPKEDGALDSAANWMYNRDAYSRAPADARWMDEVAGGAVEVDEDLLSGLGLKRMLGYDLQRFIATWLEKNNFRSKSALEVIGLDPRFAHLREEVGAASVFFSHIQAEDFLTATVPAIFEMQSSGRLGPNRGRDGDDGGNGSGDNSTSSVVMCSGCIGGTSGSCMTSSKVCFGYLPGTTVCPFPSAACNASSGTGGSD